jgi:zinc protease
MKNFKLLFVLVFWGFAVIAVSAQVKDLNQPIPSDPNIRIGKLENGLTYYIKLNKKPEQRVELRLAVNAGSICENDSQLGLAHFVEHMGFNGTKNFPSNKIISMLEEMGVKF